ncbi:hypothetical protein BDA96_10G125800 [Sorghum bicolor]|uniref:Uncharacterized protein n=1 Tax=Sorghum bicolor TaxID=4558 RepID=A0A921Q3J6_SORBI|nr:hypothetical protein BDA96_10G125800 [Sorghum bicolor]KAG0513711.1 hypothetical protein BDA96_10G125800 [Sorghum bicolor]
MMTSPKSGKPVDLMVAWTLLSPSPSDQRPPSQLRRVDPVATWRIRSDPNDDQCRSGKSRVNTIVGLELLIGSGRLEPRTALEERSSLEDWR